MLTILLSGGSSSKSVLGSEASSPGTLQLALAPTKEALSAVIRSVCRADGRLPSDPGCATILALPHVHAVIATIPDPELGSLSVYTDEALDAITSSAVEAGYLLDSHVIPWGPDGSKPKKEAAPSDLRIEIREAQASGEAKPPVSTGQTIQTRTIPRELEPQPGLETTIDAITSADAKTPEREAADKSEPNSARLGALIFRRSSSEKAAPDPLLVVLLVGESALRGVDRDSLQAAFKLIGESKPRFILGPFFSGSAPGLWKALEAQSAARIVTGSATGDLRLDTLDQKHKVARTVVPDTALTKFLNDRLLAMNPRAKLAVLSERGTQYAAGAKDWFPPKGDDKVSVRSYGFPMQIARLRSAHAASSGAGDERIAKLRRSLDVDLASVHPPGSDDMPVFSKLTPLSIEATLRSTFTSIARWSADYLLIVATDPADLVFLAGEARVYAPGTQLITLSNSALYGHSAFASELTGALVLSSYPLGLDSQTWQRFCSPDPASGSDGCKMPLKTLKSFASDGAQGIYNAMHWLIREADPGVRSSAPPDQSVRGSNEVGARPWLSLIDGRAWPIDYGEVPASRPDEDHGLDLTAWGKTLLPGTSSSDPPFVRPTHFAIGWAVSIFAAVVFLAFLTHLVNRRAGPSTSLFVRTFNRPDSVAVGQYQAAAYLSLSLIGGIVWVSAIQTFSPLYAVKNLVELGLARCVMLTTLLLLLPAGVILLVWHAIRRARIGYTAPGPEPDLYRRIVQSMVGAIIIVVMVFALYCVVGLWFALDDSKGGLLRTRLTDPLGACPLGPIVFLAAGLFVWAVTGLARAGGIARFTDVKPLAGVELVLGLRLSDTREPGLRTRVMTWEIGVVLTLLAPALLFVSRLLPSLEWSGFDETITALLLVLAAAVVFACVQASLFWSRLRAVLQNHAATFMIEAYNRIASKVSGSFGLQLRSHVPPPGELTASVQSLEQLCAYDAELAPPGEISVRIIESKLSLRKRLGELTAAYEEVATVMPPSAATERAVHTAFARASSELFEVLRTLWQMRAQRGSSTNLGPVAIHEWFAEGKLNTVPTGFILASNLPASTLLWIRAAEDFVAMRFTTWAYHVIDQIRWLLTFALFGGLMLVSAAFAYPIQPHRFVALFCGSVLVIAAAASFRIIWQFQTNEILRRLTPANQPLFLRSNVLQQMVTYVVLPVVLLASRVFPEFGDRLSSAMEPLLSLLQ
ncbi:MAG TPA: hypothetical protein VJV78_24800 [Polyangiales bacterium]|nr:hypothetical protein [Polyangiales bacterium]